MNEDDAVDRIYRALVAGELDGADLSARRVASFLGKTTGAIYHRWGSFDGLLFAVGQRGFAELGARVAAAWARDPSFTRCAEVYVAFGLDHPALYPLLFERRFDWAGLRAAGAFAQESPGGQLFAGVLRLLQDAGSKSPLHDARLLMAGLHGIVSLATSGRMNTGDLSTPDRAAALTTARDLAERVFPKRPARSPHPRSAKRARP